jgi:hypothetical protein
MKYLIESLFGSIEAEKTLCLKARRATRDSSALTQRAFSALRSAKTKFDKKFGQLECYLDRTSSRAIDSSLQRQLHQPHIPEFDKEHHRG